MIRAINALAKLSVADRRLLVEAWISLCIAEGLLRFLPYPLVRRALATMKSASIANSSTCRTDQPKARRVRWAIETARRRLPWKPSCLSAALAAKRLLE